MRFDLTREAWIPFRRASGRIEYGSPALITDDVAGDFITDICTPRQDFDGALQEFLIGLYTATLTPADEQAWHAAWVTPPTPAEIAARMGELPDGVFVVNGDGPRAFQGMESRAFRSCELVPIDQLLLDAPGAKTVSENRDHFVKRGRSEALGAPAAAMALIAMQAYAPSGGSGHRTSMRGGGPLTTLVEPRSLAVAAGPCPLWQTLWANVETEAQILERGGATTLDDPLAAVFPWMGTTRTSKGDKGTTPSDADPLQVYFATPRQIWLEFDGPGTCSITGMYSPLTVRGFRMKRYGTWYVGWTHPLSPHYFDKEESVWRAIHGQPDGTGWQDWVTFSLGEAAAQRRPAATVAHFLGTRAHRIGLPQLALRAFGYDTDNMKARSWVDADFPVCSTEDPVFAARALQLAEQLTTATDQVACDLLSVTRASLFAPTIQSPPGDELLSVKRPLWAATEATFYAVMGELSRARIGADEDATPVVGPLRLQFRDILTATARQLFEARMRMASHGPDALERIVRGRHELESRLTGSRMAKALGLEVAIPARAPTRPASARAKKVKA